MQGHWNIYFDIFSELFTLIAAGFAAWNARKAKTETAKNRDAIEQVDQHVNGRMETLLEVTKATAHAEGVVHEQEHPSGRQDHQTLRFHD